MMDRQQKTKTHIVMVILHSVKLKHCEMTPNIDRLGNILQQIYKLDVALEANHVAKKQLLLSFLKNFKNFCYRKSAMFAKYFHEFYFTGSYFEGLRVKEATEFDVNVSFDFPFSEFSYVVSELDVLPSYATIRLKANGGEEFKDIPFFNSKGYLVGKNILQWFQSLLDSFLNSEMFEYPGVLMVETSNSGPARTIKVFYESVWISIDLVPVFSMNVTHLNKYTRHDDYHEMAEEIKTCFVVPKPLKPELADMLPPCMLEQVWRIHFPEAEKIFFRNKNLKRVIKLVKALRDKEEWSLPSYFLKVVAFWLVKKYNTEEFCNNQNVGTLFILFLEALEEHLAKEYLGHIFYPRFNLFHCFSSSLLRNLRKRVKKIIHQLKVNPNSALVLFKIMLIPYSSLAPPLLRY